MGKTSGVLCGCEPDYASEEQRKALGTGYSTQRHDRPRQRKRREEIRRSYGCDCGGHINGRENAHITEPYFRAVEGWTGERPITCPWRAFYDPLVKDVLRLYPFYTSGQLAIVLGPDPPLYIVEAVAYYHDKIERIRIKQMEEEIKKRKKDGK